MTSRLTIEELAGRTGITVRNIRAYQTRGLLPPPVLKGRTGFYGEEHLSRLRLIKEMQASGFGLKAIKTLLQAAPEGAEEEVLRFERTLLAPWSSEEPEVIAVAELAERFGNPPPEIAARAEALGLLETLPGDRYLVKVPSLIGAAEELQALGVPIGESLDVVARVLHNSDQVTKRFVDVFLKHVWRPFDVAGRPPEMWPEVRRSLAKLRPIASRVMQSVFAATMATAVESAFARELEAAAEDQQAG